MATKKEGITSKAIEILTSNPNGVHYFELGRKLEDEFQTFLRIPFIR